MNTLLVKNSGLFAFTPVDNRFISNLMREAGETELKVYLYALMLVHGGGDASEIAPALGIGEDEVQDAFRYWEKQGLVRLISGEGENLAVEFRPTAIDENVVSARNLRYSSLIKKLQSSLGTRNLTGSELQRIYDWVEIFRFEEDAAVKIVEHCLAVKGARVHINYMDSVAKRLAADDMLSATAVSASFEREKELSSGAAVILKRWRLSRRPTEDELALYEKWTGEWGFSAEAIDIALGEMTAVERPNFKYLDAVLASYRESGSITTDALREMQRRQDIIAELAHQAFVRAGLKRKSSASDRHQFDLWANEYGMSAEMILFAADIAASSASPFADMRRRIEDWHKRGIASYQAAKNDHDVSGDTGKTSRSSKVSRSLNYRQQKYTAEQLKALGVDLGEDVYSDED